jgi:hypothetical protein
MRIGGASVCWARRMLHTQAERSMTRPGGQLLKGRNGLNLQYWHDAPLPLLAPHPPPARRRRAPTRTLTYPGWMNRRRMSARAGKHTGSCLRNGGRKSRAEEWMALRPAMPVA